MPDPRVENPTSRHIQDEAQFDLKVRALAEALKDVMRIARKSPGDPVPQQKLEDIGALVWQIEQEVQE